MSACADLVLTNEGPCPVILERDGVPIILQPGEVNCFPVMEHTLKHLAEQSLRVRIATNAPGSQPRHTKGDEA